MEDEADQATRDENKKKRAKTSYRGSQLRIALSLSLSFSLSLSLSLWFFLSTAETSSDFGYAWALFQDGTVTVAEPRVRTVHRYLWPYGPN